MARDARRLHGANGTCYDLPRRQRDVRLLRGRRPRGRRAILSQRRSARGGRTRWQRSSRSACVQAVKHSSKCSASTDWSWFDNGPTDYASARIDARWSCAAGASSTRVEQSKEAVMSDTLTQPATGLTQSQLRRSMEYFARRAHPPTPKAAVRSAQAHVALKKAPAVKSDELPAPKARVTSVSDAGLRSWPGSRVQREALLGRDRPRLDDRLRRDARRGRNDAAGHTRAGSRKAACTRQPRLSRAVLHVADAEGCSSVPARRTRSRRSRTTLRGVFDQGRTMALRCARRTAWRSQTPSSSTTGRRTTSADRRAHPAPQGRSGRCSCTDQRLAQAE